MPDVILKMHKSLVKMTTARMTAYPKVAYRNSISFMNLFSLFKEKLIEDLSFGLKICFVLETFFSELSDQWRANELWANMANNILMRQTL